MLVFSVKVDLEVQAESIDYVEHMSTELEDVISSHFDEDELVSFDFEITEQTRQDDDEGEYEE
jgi:hypothetical protein